MNKLLVICGPTATGKTKLALSLARLVGGEVLSCDSRQVYKGMDIGTGKDLPKNGKWRVEGSEPGFYKIDGVKIWGYDLTDPKGEFSVSQYIKIASRILKDIWKRGKTPIIVGGTGLYLKAVLDGIATAEIPRNNSLRTTLEEMPTGALFETLAQLDSTKAASMNSSDKNNKRRLVRAIEIAQWLIDKRLVSKNKGFYSISDCLIIGLFAPKEYLAARVKLRVDSRLKGGILEEVKALLSSGLKWESQAMNSMGYLQWRDYFEHGASMESVLEKWIRDETSYVKRQMTWFKKDERIIWFDISKGNFSKEVENMVKKWYHGPVKGNK